VSVEHVPAIGHLANGLEAVACQLSDWVREGREPERLQERATLIGELLRELQHHVDDELDAREAETIANTLIERARQV
jgi:hypothetical protein